MVGRTIMTLAHRMLSRIAREDRGDVPGWVLITLMTAGLVIIIWGLAGPALSSVFQQAIDRVTGF
jgi:short subunit fatty acids transporter